MTSKWIYFKYNKDIKKIYSSVKCNELFTSSDIDVTGAKLKILGQYGIITRLGRIISVKRNTSTYIMTYDQQRRIQVALGDLLDE